MMKSRKVLSSFSLMLMLALLAVTASQVLAQSPVSVSDDDVNRVASQLYCPVCENVTLDVCPTDACARWRESLRGKLALGWTDQQVIDYFVTQYGASVSGIPPKEGLSMMLYMVPPAAAVLLLAGGFLIVRKYKAVKPAPMSPVSPATARSDSYRKKLEDDIEKELER